MAPLYFTAAARAHLHSIKQYTEQKWGVKQWDAYLVHLQSAFETIKKAPEKGKLRADVRPGLRSARCQKHVIYYLLRERKKTSEIRILGVLHERMDPALHLMLH